TKSVADRAVAVQADELVRKPFQPQELIGRVRNLLNAGKAAEAEHAEPSSSPQALDSLFAPPSTPARVSPIAAVPPAQAPSSSPVFAEAKPAESVWPRAL